MTSGTPESQPPQETISVTVRFDFAGTPEERVALQEQAQDAIRALGGIGITTEFGPSALERCLDGHFDWLLQDLPPQRLSISQGSLRSQGFESVRDIFVMGGVRLRALGEIGPKAIASIKDQAAASTILTIPFKDEPTVEDMAAWCSHPNQIPAQVVMPSGFNNCRYQYVEGRLSIEEAAANTTLFRRVGGSPRISERARSLIDDFWRLKSGVSHE